MGTTKEFVTLPSGSVSPCGEPQLAVGLFAVGALWAVVFRR